MESLRFFLCLFLFCGSSLSLVCGHGLPKNHVALFVFGDSLFDPGNNNYINTIGQANFPPYGETFFKYPTGRFSDGRLIPDFIGNTFSIFLFVVKYDCMCSECFGFLAAEYANLPLIPPYLQLQPGNHQFTYGINFASAGAGALAETNQGFVWGSLLVFTMALSCVIWCLSTICLSLKNTLS